MSAESKNDSAVRFLFENGAVRGVWVQLQQSFAEMLTRRPGSPAACELLGESVAAAVLLSRTIKLQGRLALQARGDGLLQLLVAECTQDAGVRGVIEIDETVAMPLLPLRQLVGDGYLAVTLLPDEGDSYQGIVPLQGARLQDCLADYFVQSEQLPTALWLAADGERAAGLMLQALPSTDHDDGAAWQHLYTLASTVTSGELLSLSCEALLHRLFHQDGVRLFGAEPVRFQCTCSVERSRSALAVLGRDELQKLFAEQPDVTVDCQFCGAHYTYSAADMREVLGEHPASLH